MLSRRGDNAGERLSGSRARWPRHSSRASGNPLLKARAGLPDEEPGRACPKCGEVVMMAATSAGIRDVLTRHSDGLWRLANSKRVAIMHGTRPFSEIHPGLPTIASNVRAALRRGVLDLLSIDDADRAPFHHEPIPTPMPHRATLRYALRGRTLDSIVVGQAYPRLALRRIEGERFRGVDGRTNERARSDWEPTDFIGEWIYGGDADLPRSRGRGGDDDHRPHHGRVTTPGAARRS